MPENPLRASRLQGYCAMAQCSYLVWLLNLQRNELPAPLPVLENALSFANKRGLCKARNLAQVNVFLNTPNYNDFEQR